MSTANDKQRPPEGRWLDKLLPLLGITLVTGGFILLSWFAYLWLTPQTAPYHYQLIAEGEANRFPELELEAWPTLKISKYEIRIAEKDQPIALAYFGQKGKEGPVLLNWENQTGEPLIALERKPSELSALASAIGKYVSPDALILAWWDTSRQIHLLSERNTLFNAHLNEPLIIPARWQQHADTIRAYESDLSHSVPTAQERDQFQRFTEALLQPPEAGAARLRDLIGPNREAYLVIHVSDLYKLGLLHPDKFGVAYKNFVLTGNIHGLINHMKVEMKEHDYSTYTLQSLSDRDIRAFFLADEPSTDTLMAHLLPFTEKEPPLNLKAVQLVYQQGGYWVYKLP